MAATIDDQVAELERANAQLRRQLDACGAELKEARDQQTATAEVLQVINSSPGDLAPVFDAILEKAHSLCGIARGSLELYDGVKFRSVALRGLSGPLMELLRQPFEPMPGTPPSRLLGGERIVQIIDMAELANERPDDPRARAGAESGLRTALFVPLRKGETLLGLISAGRQEVRPFSEKQVALLQNFAAQAVIAMENARLLTETREALEQQTATAEVLQVINSSPGDLAPVFNAVIENSMRLCEATQGHLYIYADGQIHAEALRGEPQFVEWQRRRGSHPVTPGSPTERALRGEQVIHIADATRIETYRSSPAFKELIDRSGIRTGVTVALRRDEAFLGTINVYRQEVRPFSDEQIALLQNFAAQAVIAMENARLLTETREALEQQTATAEVLQVINSSPGDLAPVFDAMLEKATRLCEAASGILWTYDGSRFRAKALHGVPAKLADSMLNNPSPKPMPTASLAAIAAGQNVVRDDDLTRVEGASRVVDIGGMRTGFLVALRKNEALLGAIRIFRREARPFSEKQVALVQNFAAQAVIAMENARLLTETREALEQQTATAEVLQVINSSPGDLAPVFDTMLGKARRLCEAELGLLLIYEGDCFHAVSLHGAPEAYVEFMTREPIRPGPHTGLERLVQQQRLVHIADLSAEQVYRERDPLRVASVELAGMRTFLAVPLVKEEALLGAFVLYRQEVRPFSEKQTALLQNFAAQAVIAMENARLLTETREALAQQTATAEVLGVINSSPGNLAPVFDAMLDKAIELCEAKFGGLWTCEGDAFAAPVLRNVDPRFAEVFRHGPYRPGPATTHGRVLRGERIVHIPDLIDDEAYRAGDPVRHALVELAGVRCTLGAALRRGDAVQGVIIIYREEAQPFSEKHIALLQNFGAQAEIAMENARLLTETREALEQQTATAEVLQVINSSPGDLAPVFDAMLEKAMRLCEAALGVLWTYDGDAFHATASRGAPPAYAEFLASVMHQPGPNTAHGRLLRGSAFEHLPDVASSEDYRLGDAFPRALVDLAGGRTILAVPLRKDDAFLGDIFIYRQEVRPFSDKQIALLQNFAAQAVIAMENARLITETREALEQQTATAEVLQVINSSPGDLAPVFDAMLDKAVRLCDFAFAALWTYDGTAFHPVALYGMPAAFEAYLREHTPPAFKLLHDSAGPIHFPDVMATEMPQRDPEFARVAQQLGSVRTLLLVPLRKDAGLLGAFVAYRQEVRPFSDKQIALLQNFAAQAVIAMENARLLTETREALEQQTATAQVLQVINSSPGDLAPVFDAMLDKAMRLCEAAFGTLWTYDGACVHAAALHNVPPVFAEFLTRAPHQVGPDSAHGRLLRGEPVVHIPDIVAEKAYRLGDPIRRALVELGGGRTLLAVPLRKDSTFLGDFVIYRQEARPFSDKQIALLQNFAAQAVIAMENARLFGELRQRTADLQESLEYQTATSDVLKVISRSTFDLEAVLEAVVSTAIRLCRAEHAAIYRNEDGEYQWAAGNTQPPEYERIERSVRIRPGIGTLVGRTALEGRTVQIPDVLNDPFYEPKEDARVGNARTMLGVPLLRENAVVGVIGLVRNRVEPFSEREIALVTTFADQAVIAIENARLLNDLQGRTHDLQESLEYQTATSDVLKVISQSESELDSVLDTVVETATRICEGANAIIFRLRDGKLHLIASYGVTADYRDFLINHPHLINRGTLVGRTASEQQVVHITDVATDPEYTFPESQQLGELHTMLGVPLIREGALIGVLALNRKQVEPFTNKQIALVTTFADQAVIAIENARLFGELRDRTAELGRSVEELKMLGEVGRAVSSTLDLRTVLSTILTASLGVTWANAGAVFRYSRAERAFRLVEAVGWDEALARSVGEMRVAESETAMGRAIAARGPVELPDLAELPSTPLRDATLAAGFHSALIVPLVGAERIFGALVLQRREAGEFPAETVRLMQTLASQSVLAIQNARLFREIADKSEQLALASQHKSQFLANMSHELRTPLNAILGYAELLVDGIYGLLPEKAQGVLERVQNNGKHLLALINDVLDLAKIEAGQLALTLEDYALAEIVRGVVTATEPLAEAKGLKFTAIVQEGMPMAHGDARRVSQVLLNLAGNAIKFTDAGEVEINASAVNGQFLLTVRDTGPGIADADQERIFGEFQQIENTDTRKKGGTGLGLAISKRMVEMQGGLISVDSVLGAGSTFRVVLPVHVEPALEEAV